MKNFIHKVKNIIIILTTKCNLKCNYCYLGDIDPVDMPESIIDKIISILEIKNTPIHLQITGGEALLFPSKIEKICKKLSKLKIKAKISLQTNGTLIDSSIIKMIKNFDIRIGISIDGPKEIHEITRGGFNRIISGINLLRAHYIPFQVTCVVTSKNILHLSKLAILLSSYENAQGMALDMVVLKGRAKGKKSLLPSIEDIHTSIPNLIKTIKWINSSREFHLREIDLLLSHSIKKHKFCYAIRKESIAISPYGDLYPCSQTALDSNFYLGNIEDNNISDYPYFLLKPMSLPHCSGCNISSLCIGDCASRVYYNSDMYIPTICNLYRDMLFSYKQQKG